MSELTPCNACTLAWITREAAKRGATVRTEKRPFGNSGDWWIAVIESDRDEPQAWFMELTVHCCC